MPLLLLLLLLALAARGAVDALAVEGGTRPFNVPSEAQERAISRSRLSSCGMAAASSGINSSGCRLPDDPAALPPPPLLVGGDSATVGEALRRLEPALPVAAGASTGVPLPALFRTGGEVGATADVEGDAAWLSLARPFRTASRNECDDEAAAAAPLNSVVCAADDFCVAPSCAKGSCEAAVSAEAATPPGAGWGVKAGDDCRDWRYCAICAACGGCSIRADISSAASVRAALQSSDADRDAAPPTPPLPLPPLLPLLLLLLLFVRR